MTKLSDIEHQHTEAGYREWDKVCEDADKRQAIIDTRVDEMFQDIDKIAEVLAENADVFASIVMKSQSGTMSREDMGISILETTAAFLEDIAEGEID
jgi:C4-type Zn-finger protein